MLDVWIIEEARRRERSPTEQPFLQLPVYQEPLPSRKYDDRERDEDEEGGEDRPHGHVIVIDMV